MKLGETRGKSLIGQIEAKNKCLANDLLTNQFDVHDSNDH